MENAQSRNRRITMVRETLLDLGPQTRRQADATSPTARLDSQILA
jgi:hypothetical protein